MEIDARIPGENEAPLEARVGRGLLALAVVLSALLLGSLLSWALSLVAGLLAISNMLLWWRAPPFRARPAATAILAVGVGLTLATALQVVPLPTGLLARVAPANADVWLRALRPFDGGAPAWAPLSLDPIATRVQVLRGVTYLMAFLAALRVAQSRDGAAFLTRVAIGSATLMAFGALAHPLVGAEKVFGLYDPTRGGPVPARHIAPLINPNHLAAYLNIGFAVGFGELFSRRPVWPRPILAAIVLLLFATNVWVASRGGFVAMGAALAVVLLLVGAVRRGGRSVATDVLLIGAVVGAAVAMIVLSSGEDAWVELASADVSKVSLAREGLRLVPLFPWFGVGRGTYEVAFPAVRTTPGYVTFTHPENVLVQWTTEWGLPVALLALGMLAWTLRPSTMMARSLPPVGAWAALAATALHNLVDYNSEVPAVVVGLSLLVALIVGGAGGGANRRVHDWPARGRVFAAVPAVIVLLLVPFVLIDAGHELHPEREAMRALAEHDAPAEAFDDAIGAALKRHPADSYIPYAGGVHAVRQPASRGSVFAWVGRALERSPVFGAAHVVLARVLAARNPSQARLEYRTAVEQDLATYGNLVAEALVLVRTYEDALSLLPMSASRQGVLDVEARGLADRLPSTASRLDGLLALEARENLQPLRSAAREGIEDLLAGASAPWCERARPACEQTALQRASGLRDAEPKVLEGYQLLAQTYAAMGQASRAGDELEAACDKVEEVPDCLRQLALFARDRQDKPRVQAALDRLSRAGCSSPETCEANLHFIAQVQLGLGNQRLALAMLKQAYDRQPSTGVLAEVAALQAQAGLHAEALESYQALARNDATDARWSAAVLREKDALAKSLADRIHR